MGQWVDLNASSIFVKVVDEGSFRGAARALGIPKTTVSRRVAELEERLGARLLQRTTRSVRLTEAGLALHRRAAAAIAELRDAERAVTDLADEPRGLLRVSAPLSFGAQVLPAVVTELLHAHADLSIVLDLTNRHVDLVAEGFDAAVRVGKLADSSLVAQRIGGTSLRFFAASSYLDRRGVPSTPEDLADHDCLLFGSASEATWAFRGPRKPREIQVHGRLACSSFQVLRDVALAGLGIARLPSLVGLAESRGEKLRPVLDAHVLPAVPIHVLYPSARHLSPGVRAFTERLRAHLPQAV